MFEASGEVCEELGGDGDWFWALAAQIQIGNVMTHEAATHMNGRILVSIRTQIQFVA